MSKIYADTIETENPNVDITLGAAGDAVLIPSGATLKTNKIADAGGNNLFTSDGSGTLTVNSAFGGGRTLLATNTFTGTTASNFTTLIDSTYDVYIFRYGPIYPASAVDFTFNVSTDGGSNYNITKTTTYFQTWHQESDAGSDFSYQTGRDLAQSTSYQILMSTLDIASDANTTGELHLFSPSNTTFMKQFYAISTGMESGLSGGTLSAYVGGYFDTTSAIDAISFKMASGNMDGEIKMYGISKS